MLSKLSKKSGSQKASPIRDEGLASNLSGQPAQSVSNGKFKVPHSSSKANSTSEVSKINGGSSSEAVGEKAGKEKNVKSCLCCGTIVYFSAHCGKYRCSVCHTANVFVDLKSMEFDRAVHPHPLSLKYVKKLLQSCVQNAEEVSRRGEVRSAHELFEPLSTYLYNALRTYASFNNSFKINHHSRRPHYSSSNINDYEVRQTFNILTTLPTQRPLYYSLVAMLELLRRVEISSKEDVRELSWLLIILDIPFLYQALIDSNPSAHKHHFLELKEIKSLCYEILKRTFGLLANSMSETTSNYISSWYSKLSREDFVSKVDLVNLYITFQLKKYYLAANKPLPSKERHSRPISSRPRTATNELEYFEHRSKSEPDDFVVSLSSRNRDETAANTPSHIPRRKSNSVQENKIRIYQYGNDWHLRTASVFLTVLVKSNKIRNADKLPDSVFYNSLVDFVNLKLDFDSWQTRKKSTQPSTQRKGSDPELQTVIDYIQRSIHSHLVTDSFTFCFCQFPFLISLGGKISLLEYEARRQMERKAEEAFINSLDKRVAMDAYFKVKVRREYIVQDSLKCIKMNSQNLKKSLRVFFVNEPGIDAGGLRKEWFSLLTQALFNPQAGIFVNIEDSNLLWFNIVPLELYEMYYLFGAILGLAIYNSTILNLKFPKALYKLLLNKRIDQDDYQQLYPVSAANLFKLRDLNEEDLAAVSLTFEIVFTDILGKVHSRELIPGGKRISVHYGNRELYIEKYAKFFMCDGIDNQSSFFKKGFSTVVLGNAFSVFLPEEIELLLCGSDEDKLDIDILKSITKYVGWKERSDAVNSLIVQWFWEFLESLHFLLQKKFLAFVTGSDRIPATGIQHLNFKISRAGKDSNRLPIAHTCFNELAVYEYSSKEKFFSKLETAIYESLGFGIK